MDTSKINTEFWSALTSVLDGNATDTEKQLIENWVAKDKKNAAFFNQLNDPQHSKTIKENATLQKDHIFAKTQFKISQLAIQRKLQLWKYIAVASIILLIGISSIDLFRNNMSSPLLVEAKSPSGISSKLRLSDGTLVEINANSSICYPTFFNGADRKVTLNGEAYFEVTKDAKHPFVVETNGVKITVLGTRFNIKSYEEDNKITTSLLEGSVQVEFDHPNVSKNRNIILSPDQQLVFDKTTHRIEVKEVKADLYASWKNGQCFFENEKFSEICKILERQFGVNIKIVSPSLNNQLYSGFFTKKEGLVQILNSFRKIKNFEFHEQDTGFEIYER